MQNPGRFRQGLEITNEAFLLGVGTKLAGPGLGLDHARILALLAAAYGQSVSPCLLSPIEKASHFWQRGEKCLAQLQLCFIGLLRLSGPQAFALYAADALLHAGLSPRDLLKGLGLDLSPLDPSPLDLAARYNLDQPRVPTGNWHASGQFGSSEGGTSPHAQPIELIGQGQGLSNISAQPAEPTVQVVQDIKCSAFSAENAKNQSCESSRSVKNCRRSRLENESITGSASGKFSASFDT